jgi:hypothetical protein
MIFLFNALVAKLQQLPALKWIDLDKGQIDQYELRPPISYPAVLIGIQYPRTESIGAKKQQVDALINLRLVVDYAGPTSHLSPAEARAESLQYLQLAEEVFALLQGYGSDRFNKLDRRNMREERRPDGLKVVNISFATSFVDTAGATS